jgi:DNA-binding NarL/FixJ family response regulator
MKEQINIALTEDNSVNRNVFRQKISELEGIDLVFVAHNGEECLSQLKGLPVNKMPAIVFMDIEMPMMNGIECIARAHALYPSVHFLVLTVFDDDDKIFEAIKAGASGYLLKHEPAAVINEAIVNVLEHGGAPMSPAIARKALSLLGKANPSSETPKDSNVPVNITDREKEILQYLVSGRDAKRISAELGLSVLTVRKHIANIYEKLHIRSRAEAINMAHKGGWFKN